MASKRSRRTLPDISPTLESVYRALAIDPGLWNRLPCTPSRFASECGRLRGLGNNPFREDILWRLWQAGLLRADLVVADDKVRIEGLELVEEADPFTYLDSRKSAQIDKGWVGLLAYADDRPAGVLPRFHRYRYLVLPKILELVKPRISPLQFMFSDSGIMDVTADWQEDFRQHTATPLIAEFINHWNSIAMLAAACEPVAFPTISRTFSASLPHSFERAHQMREQYLDEILAPAISGIGLAQLEEIRRKLCRLAQHVEPNLRVQMLLRVASYSRREGLRGDLGTAMLFLEMAECLRRVAERVFEENLPEEDQMNYTVWAKGARRNIYGSDRALDAPRDSSRTFMRYFGLDPGIKVRCYVEGDTELGALEYSVGPYEHVEIVNLRGQFATARGKGLAFRESLESDMKKKVFSFVILDGDRGENLRAVQRAIRDGSFFGEVFISEPDFERQNFSLKELRSLVLQIAAERGADKKELTELRLEIEDIEDVSQLMEQARRSSDRLIDLGKNKEWGSRLVQYAFETLENEKLFLDQDTYDRPLLEMIARILRATRFHYDLSREKSRVDPNSGRLVSAQQ